MKKLMSMVLVLLFILSTLVFTNSFYVDELRTASSQAVLHKTVNTGIDTIVSEINSVVPIDPKESVEVLKTKIETDPLVNSMIDKYSLIVLHDLSNNDSETSINEDVHLALDTYTKEIESEIPNIEQLKEIIDEYTIGKEVSIKNVMLKEFAKDLGYIIDKYKVNNLVVKEEE